MATSKNARRDGAEAHATRALAREVGHAFLLVLAGASALYVLAYLPSRIKTDALRARRDKLAADKERLARELEGVRAETAALEKEPWAVERALRRQLGFLRPGERVLRIER